MGGDGGVIAVNRKYMRGVSTSIIAQSGKGSMTGVQRDPKEVKEERMRTCHVSGNALNKEASSVVACDLGLLYDREEIVGFLLRRATGEVEDLDADEALPHIRSLKDLHPVDFGTPCPVTGTETSNGGSAAFLLVVEKAKKKSKKEKESAVASASAAAAAAAEEGEEEEAAEEAKGGQIISERAIKELGTGGVLAMFAGEQPARLVKILPDAEELEKIKVDMEERRAAAAAGKRDKKSKKSKKGDGADDSAAPAAKKAKKSATNDIASVSSSINVAAALAVAQANQGNSHVNSMFHKTDNSVGDANALFARTGGGRFK
jgi:hypothetical protein